MKLYSFFRFTTLIFQVSDHIFEITERFIGTIDVILFAVVILHNLKLALKEQILIT